MVFEDDTTPDPKTAPETPEEQTPAAPAPKVDEEQGGAPAPDADAPSEDKSE